MNMGKPKQFIQNPDNNREVRVTVEPAGKYYAGYPMCCLQKQALEI